MKKYALIIVVILISFMSIGCDFSTTPDSMIRAPRSSEVQIQQKQQIISLLDKEESLIVPEKMVNKAPYIQIDTNDDQQEEVIAFYRNRVNKFELGLLILEQQGNKWRVRQNIAEYGIDINYFKAVDFDQDQLMELVVGIKSGVKNTLHVYKLQNGQFNKVWDESYDYMDCGDINGDGREEIILVNSPIELDLDTSVLKILEMKDEKIECSYETRIAGYCQNIVVGQVEEGVYGAYMVFYENYSDVSVKLMTYTDGEYIWAMEWPTQQIPPESYQGKMFSDIDGDNILEFCYILYPQNYRYGDPYTPALMEIWSRFNPGKESSIELISITVSNTEQGYSALLPFNWYEGVVYECVSQNGTDFVNFYQGEQGKETFICSIVSIDAKNWARLEQQLPYPAHQIELGRNHQLDKIYVGMWADNNKATETMMKQIKQKFTIF